MVFAIPDWEDGNTKSTVFSEKAKVKQHGSPKKSPQKKTSPKKAGKVNGVAEKSKLINKENKKQLKRHKQKENNIKTAISKRLENVFTAANHKNGLQNTKKQETGKVKSINEKSTKKQNNEKPRKIKLEKLLKDNCDSSLKVDNLDTDKLDEVLLNAKKKKFNEALQRDDVEALLFTEDKSPEVVKKKNPRTELQNEQQNSFVTSKVDKHAKVIGKKQMYTEKKQKQVNSKTAKVKNTKNNITKLVIDKEIFKVNPAINGLKENNNNNDESSQDNNKFDSKIPSLKTSQDRKKDKLKLILKKESNRNPINFNRNKLRERMLDRLKSAQFRFLNEKLYTSSGSEASQLFQNDPSAFQSYHEGYQLQLKKWPVNPLDVIVKRIKKMPKSHLIADMGCGSASLSARVPHAVRSFDLVAASPAAEACDMAHTPLLTASVDAVVYCLALMGTDLTAYLIEANRVLKMGGHLLIAEVESRFTDVNAFTKDVSRLGFKLLKLDREQEVFLFMEFIKNQAPPVKKSKLPVLTLKPCIYKRR